jgi:hypothetical protein
MTKTFGDSIKENWWTVINGMKDLETANEIDSELLSFYGTAKRQGALPSKFTYHQFLLIAAATLFDTMREQGSHIEVRPEKEVQISSELPVYDSMLLNQALERIDYLESRIDSTVEKPTVQAVDNPWASITTR